MHWLKLYTEIVNDPKIQLLAPSDRWHYVVILCAKADGLFNYNANLRLKMLEVQLRLTPEEMTALYDRLLGVMLINEDWSPAGWDKRQVVNDPTGKLRKRAQREREKNKDKDIDIDIESHETVTGKKRDKCDIKDFEEAWAKYPRKVGKAEAKKQYLKLPKDLHLKVMADLTRRNKYKEWEEEKKFILHFATYLSKERWKDEPDSPIQTAGGNYV
tara:strand:+ start:3587 stop:4231 length:645 start_codon:yes stop_codon:yes gene_type:complete